MRIVEDTPARLRLRDRTLWISVACVIAAVYLFVNSRLHGEGPMGLVAATLALTFALAFMRATDVAFDKAARICQLWRLDVLKITRLQLEFAQIVDVRVDVSPFASDADEIGCRLMLV